MRDAPEIREELVRIREGFHAARTSGLWRSCYPQSQWSEMLGCDIREQLNAGDPALTIVLRRPSKVSVHSVGFAVSGPCSVWSR